MARRSGLGRGLEAILPTEAGEAVEGDEIAGLRELALTAIRPNRRQPRQVFDETLLADLASSIRELGVLQPILVRPAADDTYELVAGERRWRAAGLAGLSTIPALVVEVDDGLALEQALVENLQRDDLNPIEAADAFQQLIDSFGLTQDQVATRVGKSRSAVANTLRLRQLPEPLRQLVAEGALSAGHARALLGTDDQAFQAALAKRIVASELTVRQIEAAVRSHGAAPEPASPEPGSTKATALLELERLLSDRLDTKVVVELGAKRGRIEIGFADLQDLERIFLLLTP